MHAVAFGGLFALNAGLSLLFGRIATHEADTAAARDTTIRRLEEALAENARLQEQLVEQGREAGVRDERERLALEIHDTIAQSLIGVVTQLQAAADAADPEAAHRHHERAADLAREALGEARRSVQGLLPRRLDDADLGGALADLVDDWSQATGVPGEVIVTGEPTQVHRDVDSTVVRVAQESLANVGKHAGASRVAVTLSYMDAELTLDVYDDGVGFDPDAVAPPARAGSGDGAGDRAGDGAGDGAGDLAGNAAGNGGVGLHGMRQRAARLAGELVVESAPGSGTAVSLRVPLLSHG
jgi:signal transduction histidine kinase